MHTKVDMEATEERGFESDRTIFELKSPSMCLTYLSVLWWDAHRSKVKEDVCTEGMVRIMYCWSFADRMKLLLHKKKVNRDAMCYFISSILLCIVHTVS